MRAYWPISLDELRLLESGNSLNLNGQTAVAATSGFASTLETTDQDELDLMAALAASDLAEGKHVVAVAECDVEIVDDALGEVRFSRSIQLTDIACLLIADVESQELSWFGIQEIAELEDALKAKGQS